MIHSILSNMTIVPAAFLCLIPTKGKLKFGLLKTLIIIGAYLAVITVLTTWVDVLFDPDPYMLLFMHMIPLYFVCRYCLSVHNSKLLSVFASVAALFSILAIYALGYDAYTHPELGASSYTLDYSIVYLMEGTAAAALLAFPMHKYGSRLIDRLNIPTVWYRTVPFSALIIIIAFFFRPIKYETFHVNRVAEAVVWVTTAILFIWILMHITFYFVVMGILDAAKTREEKRILELRENQFTTQQRYIQETARARHDFRHSIRTMRELCDMRDYAALGEYLKNYEESLPANDVQPFCTNNALNALLNYYVGIAVKYGIDIQIKAKLPDILGVSEIDVCRIVGNILENAINAGINSKEKKIRLSLTEKDSAALYIIATNSFDGNVKKKDGKYISIYKNGSGIGLASIESIAEGYGGVASFSHKGSEFFSNVAIPLQSSQPV